MLTEHLSQASYRLGLVDGRMEALGFGLRQEASLDAMVQEVRKSSEIEGDNLDEGQIRSSVAKRLGMDIAGLPEADRHVDGVVEMALDATQNYRQPITADRLFGWHSALFPTGRSGVQRIQVGTWRDTPMQVVSGSVGREKVHFEAVDSKLVPAEMERFLAWLNEGKEANGLIEAAIAHFWFVTIHPFEDGNGRIGRALMDYALARSEQKDWRSYSMSAQIQRERKKYYEILEQTQRQADLDITAYLLWFVACFERALREAETALAKTSRQGRFWQTHSHVAFNERQRKMLAILLDDFFGKLTNAKWSKLTGSSHDTALRDLTDLVEKGILLREGAGRGAGYLLALYDEPKP